MSAYLNYTLKITIDLGQPSIWRRILVPSDIKLTRLHAVIQLSMGSPTPLQHFFIDHQRTVYAYPTWDDLPKIKSAHNITLEKLLQGPGDRIGYFCGDDDAWEHTVALDEITETPRRTDRAICLAANRNYRGARERRKDAFLLSQLNRVLKRVRV